MSESNNNLNPRSAVANVGTWAKSIREEAKKKIVTIAVTSVFAVVAIICALTWTEIKTAIKSSIVEIVVADKQKVEDAVVNAIVDELKKKDNRLLSSVKETVSILRQSEIGAISVGNITLNSQNRAYTLYLYFPDGHSGKVHYKVRGTIAADRQYLVLVFPNGQTHRILNPEDTIDLKSYVSIAPDTVTQAERIFARPQYMQGLRAITFQLEGTDTDQGTNAAAIEIRYFAFVSPPIQIGEHR